MRLMNLLLDAVSRRRVQPGVVEAALVERERLAELSAEEALGRFRAIRMEFDPRSTTGRHARLDAIHDRISEVQQAVEQLKGEPTT